MKYKIYSHNYAELLLSKKSEFAGIYDELLDIIDKISDEEIVRKFEEIGKNSKSISITLSTILEEKLLQYNWHKEEEIFENNDAFDVSGKGKRWTLDYYKNEIALEIAFNHEETSAWNIIKIPLASNPNKYKQKNAVKIGIIICATNQMKSAGGFDSSVGSFEKYQQYIDAMEPMVSTPLLLIGLHSPEEFKILHRKDQNRKVGKVRGTLL